MTSAPRAEVSRLVERLFPGASLREISGDASTRRFFRIRLPSGGSLVVMDYGGPFGGDTDDVRLARVFRDAGLPVARIERIAGEVGCLLLEDLGERSLETALLDERAPERRRALFERAVDLALAVAVRGTPALERSDRAPGPALDAERFRFEMVFFLDHYVRGLLGLTPPAGLRAALDALADAAAETPAPVLCHRDFHSRNLMLRADGSLAMVDIQDARWGPDGYDLASLLFDAYAGVDDATASALIERYRAGLPARAATGFRERLDVVAAQRMIKALGTFGYQARVLGRARYLEGVPRTLERLSRLLPALPLPGDLASAFRAAKLFDPPEPSPGC